MKKFVSAAAVLGFAASMTAGSMQAAAQQQPGKLPWKQMPGVAVGDVGAGGGQIYHLGRKKGAGGQQVYRWTGKGWQDMNGSGVRLDVGPKGLPWVVNNKNDIYRHNGTKWLKMPGKARDIGVGANGMAWVIGTNKVPGGFDIYRLRNNGWQKIAGGAVRIDVGPKGNAWVVNDRGAIFRFDGRKWNRMPGQARDIAIGGKPPFARVWVLGWNKTKFGHNVFGWNGKGWARVQGQLMNIGADAAGRPVGANNKGGIYAHAGSRVWKPAPLPGQDPAVWKQRQANTKRLIGMNRKKAADLQNQLKSVQDQLNATDTEHKKLVAQLKKVESELAKLN